MDELRKPKVNELDLFLRLANDSCDEALNELHNPLRFLDAVDSLYMDFFMEAGGIKPATAGILLMNAHSSLRAAMGLAFSGQLLPVFMALRGSIESALYANAIACNSELQDVWLTRDSDEKTRKTCRKEFTAEKMFRYLSKKHEQGFSDKLRDIYDSTIDFGAHPNSQSLINSTRIEALGTGEHALNFTYIHGVGSLELRQSLVACAEIGLEILFVNLICFEMHPRLNAINQRALELQDQVPKFIEQLGLGAGLPE